MATPLRILFIDDDKFLLEMYALKFSKNNFEVNTALGAEDGLRLVRGGFVPDILVLDIVMPTMDGLELLGILRKEELIKNSVVIMLTNQGLADDIAKAKKLNVDGYIIKATTIPSEVFAEVNRIYNNVKNNK